MLGINWEIWAFIVTQLMTFAALRQQVKDLARKMDEEYVERKLIDARLRKVEIALGPQLGEFLAVAKKQGA